MRKFDRYWFRKGDDVADACPPQWLSVFKAWRDIGEGAALCEIDRMFQDEPPYLNLVLPTFYRRVL